MDSNRNCASAPSLESIFRARVSKIVFRQHRSIAWCERFPRHVAFPLNCGRIVARSETTLRAISRQSVIRLSLGLLVVALKRLSQMPNDDADLRQHWARLSIDGYR